MAQWAGYVSSALLGLEAIRACSRHRTEYARDARDWLFDVSLLPLDDALLEAAAALWPASLRSLDALHLATALSIREDLGAFLTYDERLARAAEEQGLAVVRPA
jgi:predicted nucleic acid-binding protein